MCADNGTLPINKLNWLYWLFLDCWLGWLARCPKRISTFMNTRSGLLPGPSNFPIILSGGKYDLFPRVGLFLNIQSCALLSGAIKYLNACAQISSPDSCLALSWSTTDLVYIACDMGLYKSDTKYMLVVPHYGGLSEPHSNLHLRFRFQSVTHSMKRFCTC